MKTVTQSQLSTKVREGPSWWKSLGFSRESTVCFLVTQDPSISHNFHSGADAISISHRTMRHAVDSGHWE